MPVQEGNIFVLSSGDAGMAAKANLSAMASADAQAFVRRGIALEAGAEAGVAFRAKIGETAGAELDAAMRVGAGVTFRAQLPIDLFDRAGIVAQARIGAYATAEVRAALVLDASRLTELFGVRLDTVLKGAPQGTRSPLAIFLKHTRVTAGAFAEAHFAALAEAQFVVAGSLLPSHGQPAGFAVNMNSSVAFGFGGGYRAVAGFAMEDPSALVHELVDELTGDLVERLQAVGRQEAATVLRVLLPAAARIAMTAGEQWADDQPRRARSIGAMALDQLRVALREIVLETCLQAAVAALQERVLDLASELADVPAERITAAIQSLGDAQAALNALRGVNRQDPAALALAVAGLLDALRRTVDLLAADDRLDELRQALGVAAAVAGLFGWATAGRPAEQTLPEGLRRLVPVAVFDAQSLADLIIDRVDLSGDPAVAAALDWITDLAGIPLDRLLADLLGDLSAGSVTQMWDDAELDRRADALLAGIRARADGIVEEAVQQLTDGGDQAASVLVSVVARPMLAVLTDVIADAGKPRGAADSDAIRRMREQMSAALLQLVGRFVIAGADGLIGHALEEGADKIRTLADWISDDDNDDDAARLALEAMVAVASSFFFGIGLDARTASNLLDFAADLLDDVNDRMRGDVTRLADVSLRLGITSLSSGRIAEIGTGDDMPMDEPQELMLELADDLAGMAVERVDDLIALYGEFLWNQALRVFDVVKAVAEAVVKVVKDVIAALEDEFEDVLTLIGKLGREISRLAGKLLEAIAKITEAVGEAWKALKRWLAEAAVRLMNEAWPFGDPFEEGTVRRVNSFLDSVDIVDDLLSAVERLARWGGDLLHAIAEGRISSGSVNAQLKALVAQAGIRNVKIAIPALPDVTIPFGDVCAGVTSAVLGESSLFSAAIDEAETIARQHREELAKKVTAEARKDDLNPNLHHVMRNELEWTRAPGKVKVEIIIGGDPGRHVAGDVITVRLKGAPSVLRQDQVVIAAGPYAISPPVPPHPPRQGPPPPAEWRPTAESDGSWTYTWKGVLSPRAPTLGDLARLPQAPLNLDVATLKCFDPLWDPRPDFVAGRDVFEEVARPDELLGGELSLPPSAMFLRGPARAAAATAVTRRRRRAVPLEAIGAGPRLPALRRLGADRFVLVEEGTPAAAMRNIRVLDKPKWSPMDVPIGRSVLTVAFDDGFGTEGTIEQVGLSVAPPDADKGLVTPVINRPPPPRTPPRDPVAGRPEPLPQWRERARQGVDRRPPAGRNPPGQGGVPGRVGPPRPPNGRIVP